MSRHHVAEITPWRSSFHTRGLSAAAKPSAIPAAPTISAVRRLKDDPITPAMIAANGTEAAVMNRDAPMIRPRTSSSVRSWKSVVYPTPNKVSPIPMQPSPPVIKVAVRKRK